jgi:hypothetical protein
MIDVLAPRARPWRSQSNDCGRPGERIAAQVWPVGVSPARGVIGWYRQDIEALMDRRIK